MGSCHLLSHTVSYSVVIGLPGFKEWEQQNPTLAIATPRPCCVKDTTWVGTATVEAQCLVGTYLPVYLSV